MVESRLDTATHATKMIVEAEQTCAKVVDQVSQTWGALLDDEKSKNISNELTVVEANITQMQNEIKKLPLEQKRVKTIEMRRL